jgi:clan AA aspartic protease
MERAWWWRSSGRRQSGFEQNEDYLMGWVYADLKMANCDDIALHRRGYLKKNQIRRAVVRSMVDSGAYMMVINEDVCKKLGLPKIGAKVAVLENGKRIKLKVVGPLEIRFGNRYTNTNAMVLPGSSEVLLGAIPMEDLDVMIDPRKRKLVVNPANPKIPKMPLKSIYRREKRTSMVAETFGSQAIRL